MRDRAFCHIRFYAAAVLMIAFGLAEVVTGIRHEFFGLSTEETALSTVMGICLGVLYVSSGALVLTARARAVMASVACLALDVIGRIVMVLSGMYPVSTVRQVTGILLGTLIAAGFGVFLWISLRRAARSS